MTLIKRLSFIIIGWLVSITLAIITLELIFGTWLHENQWDKIQKINIPRNIKINYDVKKIYGVTLPSVTYTRDKNGLRGSCPDPKSIEILTIGGSTTDQRTITDGKTYQDVLQKFLSKKYGRQICVSNAGIDGHSTFGHLESFINWYPLIEDLKPKYFLFYIGINDAFFRDGPVADDGAINYNQKIIQVIREKSAIYNLLRTLKSLIRNNNQSVYAGHMKNKPKEVNYSASNLTENVDIKIAQNTKGFSKRFRDLLLLVDEYGAQPICVSQPHIFTKIVHGSKKGVIDMFSYKGIKYSGLDYDASIVDINKAMMNLCVQSGGFFIDIYPEKFEDNDFYDGMHMTETGARRLAEYMYNELIRQNILF